MKIVDPKTVIEESIRKIVGPDVSFVVEHPKEESHGDFASNVALAAYTKFSKENPRKLAGELVSMLKNDAQLSSVVDASEINVAGPGFINFWLSKEWLTNELKNIITSGDNYGKDDSGKGKKVLVEYSSPNIAKQFSIGHLRSTIIGQSLYNLYKFLGWQVVGDNHLGDWGTQFGMIIAIVEEKHLDASILTVDEMEKLYVDFNNRCKANPKLKDKAREAFARLEKGEKTARKIWQFAVDISMKEFNRIYNMLDVQIDHAYGESFYENIMPGIIETAKKEGIARLSEGALIVEYSDLPPAMLLKSNGTTTYFTRDLATIKFRTSNSEMKSDLYIYEVGAEQSLHFKQVFAAAEKFGWAKKSSFVHVGHGLILGSDGKKMSTRKGTALKLETWLEEMIKLAEKINKETAKEVGIGAVKFNDLRHSPVTDYVFSLEDALSLKGASGPYLQYTYARCRSVIRNTKSHSKYLSNTKSNLNSDEISILRNLYQFAEMLNFSAKSMSPNIICEYLLETAQRFNAFYSNNKIIGSENSNFRVALTIGTSQIIKNGLNILGIKVLEKM